MHLGCTRRSVWLGLFTCFIIISLAGCPQNPPPPAAPTANSPGEYLFCFWNVENLFDDQKDHRTGPGDAEYDTWLSQHPAALQHKLGRLSEALMRLNEGKGPDILAICEVESIRAAELLRDALNKRLPEPALHYQTVLMKEIAGGRHISPAIITRLPAIKDRTRTHGNRQRILEAHLNVNGRELVVIASHWSSRLRKESDHGRASYADKIYGATKAMFLNNPQVDVVICGDFNDTPQDDSVTQHLRATGDLELVRTNTDLRLFNLFATKEANKGFGSHYYHKWFIFDQIVVTPGMLDDRGWACDPQSVRTINSLTRPGDKIGRPWRFGSEKDDGPRGYSDHFPVTVRLRVGSNE